MYASFNACRETCTELVGTAGELGSFPRGLQVTLGKEPPPNNQVIRIFSVLTDNILGTDIILDSYGYYPRFIYTDIILDSYTDIILLYTNTILTLLKQY